MSSGKKKVKTGGFPTDVKAQTGYGQPGTDLSHKVSANQVNTQYQHTSVHPGADFQDYAHTVFDATNQSGIQPFQQVQLREDHDYLQQHSPFGSQPMSPRSKEANYQIHNAFANKNTDNLRPRPSSENRSVSSMPHFNVKSGQVSPRSKEVYIPVQEFNTTYGADLTHRQRGQTQSYSDFPSRVGPGFQTSDSAKYARDQRQLISKTKK